MTSVEVVYSAAWIVNWVVEGWLNTSTEGTIVSAIASRVAHCASVNTSPSRGGGSGVSSGAKTFRSVLVMVVVVRSIQEWQEPGGCRRPKLSSVNALQLQSIAHILEVGCPHARRERDAKQEV